MIVIEIPWPFDLYSDAGAKKSASTHYDVMSAEQIRALPVGQLASMHCPDLFGGDGSASPFRG